MRYTQKDMRERLGISRDTLRLYERRGIIQPEVDPSNGYRYYDSWQVNLIWDCKLYQGMGFSLAEIGEILHEDDLDSLRGRVRDRRDALARELRRLELELEECELYLDELGTVPGGLGDFELLQVEERLFAPAREVHDFPEGTTRAAIRFMNQETSLTRPLFWFPDISEGRYFWGFSMRASVSAALGEDVDEHGVVRLPACRALSTRCDAHERGGFDRELFDDLVEEAGRRGLRPRGDLYGTLVGRAHGSDGYHRYVHAFLPVEC